MKFPSDFLGLNSPRDAHYERHKRDGLRMLLTYLVIYAVMFSLSTAIARVNNTPLDPNNYGLILYFLTSAAAILLYQADKPYQGTWLYLLVVTLTSLFIATATPAPILRSILFTFIQLILMAGLALSALPARTTDWALGLVTILQFLRILIETSHPAPEELKPAFVIASLALTALFSLAGILFLAGRFSSLPLRTKLLLSFLGVTLIPLTIVGSANTIRAAQTIEQYTTTDLQKAAQQAQLSLDAFTATQLDVLQVAAQNRDYILYLDATTDPVLAQNARQSLQELAQSRPGTLKSISILDPNGRIVLDTDYKQVGNQAPDLPDFQAVFASGQPRISQLHFPEGQSGPELTFSAPIRHPRGEIAGVLRASFHGEILQSLVNQANPTKGDPDALYLVLLDQESLLRLAHTTHPEYLFTSYKALSAPETSQLTAAGYLPANGIDPTSHPQPEIARLLTGLLPGNTASFNLEAAAENGQSATSFAVRLVNAPWIIIAQQSTSTIQQPVTQQTRQTLQLSLLMASLSVVAAFLVAQVLTAPVIQLTGAARSVQDGNLAARAVIDTPDEIGELAGSFNSMTGQLQNNLQILEERVAERTFELQSRSEQMAQQTLELELRSQDLESAYRRLERRAAQAQAIAEIANKVAALQDPEELLPHITRLISKQFGFYHVGIFLLDSSQRFAVLKAANSAGGERMLARGHRLEVGKTGIVGFVSETGEARIALATERDEVFFNNPDLPDTHSEMALPLRVRNTLIGVLDVQSTEENAFSQEDIQALSTLANQVSIAIENSRLFEETRKSLAEVESLYRRYLGTQWQNATESRHISGFRSTSTGTEPLLQPVSLPEHDEALQTGHTILKTDGNESTSLVIPVKIHGQTLGVLSLRQQSGRAWDEAEISLAQAIAERAAISAENALLFEQTAERAERERKVSEITSKIRSTNNPEEMIQIALTELKQALNLKDASIIPSNTTPGKDQE
jgi:GAF domain-containing protein/HAMP domain-containing protein